MLNRSIGIPVEANLSSFVRVDHDNGARRAVHNRSSDIAHGLMHDSVFSMRSHYNQVWFMGAGVGQYLLCRVAFQNNDGGFRDTQLLFQFLRHHLNMQTGSARSRI